MARSPRRTPRRTGSGATSGNIFSRPATTGSSASGEGEEIEIRLADGTRVKLKQDEGRTPSQAAAALVARLQTVDKDKAKEVLDRVGPSILPEDLEKYGLDAQEKKDEGGILHGLRNAAGSAVGGVLDLLDRPSQAVLQGIQEANEAINASGNVKDDDRGILGGLWGGLSGRGDHINMRQAMLMNKDAGGVLGDISDFALTAATDPTNLVTTGTGAAAKTGLRAVGKELGEDVAEAVVEKGAKKVLTKEAEAAVRRRVEREAAEAGAKGKVSRRVLNRALGQGKSGAELVGDEVMTQLRRRGQGGIRVGIGDLGVSVGGRKLRRPLEAARILDRRAPREAMERVFHAADLGEDVWTSANQAAEGGRYVDLPKEVVAAGRKQAAERAAAAAQTPVGTRAAAGAAGRVLPDVDEAANVASDAAGATSESVAARIADAEEMLKNLEAQEATGQLPQVTASMRARLEQRLADLRAQADDLADEAGDVIPAETNPWGNPPPMSEADKARSVLRGGSPPETRIGGEEIIEGVTAKDARQLDAEAAEAAAPPAGAGRGTVRYVDVPDEELAAAAEATPLEARGSHGEGVVLPDEHAARAVPVGEGMPPELPGHTRLYRGEQDLAQAGGSNFTPRLSEAEGHAGQRVIDLDAEMEALDAAERATAVPGAPEAQIGSPGAPGAVPGAPGAVLPPDAAVLPSYVQRAAKDIPETGELPGVRTLAGHPTSRGVLSGVARSRAGQRIVNTFRPRAAVERTLGKEAADALYHAATKARVGVVTEGQETASRLSRALAGAEVTKTEVETWARALDGGDVTVIRETLSPEKKELLDELVTMRGEAVADLKSVGVNDQDVLNHVGTRLARILTDPGRTALEENLAAAGRSLGHTASEVEADLNARRDLGPQLGVLGEGNLADVAPEAQEALEVVGNVTPNQGRTARAAVAAHLPGVTGETPLLETNPIDIIANTKNRAAQVKARAQMVDELSETLFDPDTGEQLVHRFTPEQLQAAEEARNLRAQIKAQEDAVARKLESGQALTPEEAAELEAARNGELSGGGEPSTRVKSPADEIKLTPEEKANAAARKELEKARKAAATEGGAVEERDLAAELAEQEEIAGAALDFQVPEGWGEINLGTKHAGKAYAPKEVAEAVSNVQSVFTNDTSLKSYQKLLDNVNTAWKVSATSPIIGGVGFHSRNFQGNLFNNYLAGVTNPLDYIKAGQLQRKATRAMKRVGPEGFEAALRAEKVSEADIKLLMAARERGILDNAFFTVDLAPDSRSKLAGFSKARRRAQAAGRIAGGQPVGKAIENNARMAHFISKVNSLGSYDEAAMSVKKYLFDYADLTNTERAIFGRTVAFYTFAKNNLALQASALLEKPGKFTRIPKAERLLTDDLDEEGNPLPDYAVRGGQVPLRPGLRKILGGDEGGLMGAVDLPFGAAVDTILPATQLASLAPGPVGAGARAVLPAPLEADQAGDGTQEAFRSLINVSSGALPEAVKKVFERATGKSTLTGAPIKSNQGFVREVSQLVPLLSKVQRTADDALGQGRAKDRHLGRERLATAILGLNLTSTDEKALENLGYAGLELVNQYVEDAARNQPSGVLPPLEWLRDHPEVLLAAGLDPIPELPSRKSRRRSGGNMFAGAGRSGNPFS